MSKAYNSPTARLLQSSRLFSLPRPLPAAPLENVSSTGTYRASETATEFYPTHQAIATPSSSHFRGDWGLKRPIPGKTTRSSTPSIRVLEQDTPDHITEFESAADHERSRAKWAEMGVPLVMRNKRDFSLSRQLVQSVYEEHLDNTDPNAAPIQTGSDGFDGQQTIEAKRWKYSGPFIAGMQEGEFARYVGKQLRARRDEWTEHLMNYFAKEDFEKQRQEARARGEHFGPFESAPPGIQYQMTVDQPEREAREKAEELLQEALKSGSAETEAKARQEGERLVAMAREQGAQYAAEAVRWDAPEEASKVILEGQREIKAQRALMQPLKKSDYSPEAEYSAEEEEQHHRLEELRRQQREEREARIEAIRADAVAKAFHILGAESTESSSMADAEALIRAYKDEIRALNLTKMHIQSEWEALRIRGLRPSLEALSDLEKGLRDSHDNLSSPLTQLITSFLDIPAVSPERRTSSLGASTSSFNQSLLAGSQEQAEAPPTTHPAAGLSHIRTNAIMQNHPVYGPQACSSPVLSRVLAARNHGRVLNTQAKLGVGGFVALDSQNTPTMGRSRAAIRRTLDEDPAQHLDPDLPHGNKVYVHPNQAYVDEAGRVRLQVTRADKESIAVKEGNVEQIYKDREAGALRQTSPLMSSFVRKPLQPGANYGTGLPNWRAGAFGQGVARKPRVTGFDAQVKREGAGAGDEMSTMQQLKEMSEKSEEEQK
ncbi:hypothetical protein WHR41_05433 [Cladosporium halotolerans]|uniref:Uncharacterized protein n=1 Tax=Cladosporium halotolerans TaxID=1052096 RepID=A0AB34KMR7_9PEZI